MTNSTTATTSASDGLTNTHLTSSSIRLPKQRHRMPFRTILGSSALLLHTFGPFIMAYFYYYAFQGNILSIFISLTQIIIQYFMVKVRWFVDFMQYCDLHLFFNAFTFETEDEPIIDDSSTLFAVHPHGAFSFGLFVNNYMEKFGKNAAVCGSRLVTAAPIMGMLLKMSGMISVNASSLKASMEKHRNVALLPGGFEEASLTTSKENRIFIKERKGFIKYAMRYGYKIRPVFIFGENKIYHTMDRFTGLRLFLNKLKMIGVVFWSKYGIFPDMDQEINTVVGKTIHLPELKDPTNQQVEYYHQIYIQSVEKLYKKYALIYNVKDELKVF